MARRRYTAQQHTNTPLYRHYLFNAWLKEIGSSCEWGDDDQTQYYL